MAMNVLGGMTSVLVDYKSVSNISCSWAPFHNLMFSLGGKLYD